MGAHLLSENLSEIYKKICLLGLLRNQKCNRKVAITGEICLLGRVKAVGGLISKIHGAIRAGVEILYYPADNTDEINRLIRLGKITANQLSLRPISHLDEGMEVVFKERMA